MSPGDERSVSDAVCRRVVVEGRVQGVGFRYSCARHAATAGLTGSVRNLPDGRVEAVFEGPAAAVEDLVAWCRRGPSSARVTRVEVAEEPVRGAVEFRIA